MIWLALAACNIAGGTYYEVCDLELAVEDPTVVAGQELVLDGGPFTEPIDSAATLDGVRLEVLDVERRGCTPCDECRSTNECFVCGVCIECDVQCATCTQSATVRIPADVAPGPHQLGFTNGYGHGERDLEAIAVDPQ